MEAEIKYSSQIKDMGLLTKEMIIASKEYQQTKDLGVIIQKSISDNIFMVKTERRRKELAYKIVSRLSILDDKLIQMIADSPYNTSCILALYALMKTDRLVFEFMNEVIKDKIDLMNYSLTDLELNKFIHYKEQQSEMISKWKEPNKAKVKNSLRKVLIDATILRDLGSAYIIMPPILDKNIVDYITKKGDKKYLEVMGV